MWVKVLTESGRLGQPRAELVLQLHRSAYVEIHLQSKPMDEVDWGLAAHTLAAVLSTLMAWRKIERQSPHLKEGLSIETPSGLTTRDASDSAAFAPKEGGWWQVHSLVNLGAQIRSEHIQSESDFINSPPPKCYIPLTSRSRSIHIRSG